MYIGKVPCYLTSRTSFFASTVDVYAFMVKNMGHDQWSIPFLYFFFVGTYEKENLSLTPGIITRSMSFIMFSHFSPFWGAASGIKGAK